jgi:hypothetical protein
MNDLQIAKKRLKENGLSLVFVKDRKIIFEGKFEGLRDLVLTVERLGNKLNDSSVADSSVGKAVACLFTLSKINSVFAGKISKIAIDFLKKNNIYFEYAEVVEKILNKDGTDMCPFEKIALESSPEEVMQKLKKILKI